MSLAVGGGFRGVAVSGSSGGGGGTGNVVGPASATSGHIAVYGDTTGKLIGDGGPVPTGTGDVVAPGSATPGHLAVFGASPTVLADGGAVPAAGSTVYSGVAQLVAGTVTISTTHVTADSIIMVCYGNPNPMAGFDSANAGFLFSQARTAGTQFIISSSNVADGNFVNWCIIEPNNP